MRIVLFCLVMIVLMGCGKKKEGPTLISKYSDTLPILHFEKQAWKDIHPTNTEDIKIWTLRDSDKIVVFAHSNVDSLQPPYLVTISTEDSLSQSSFTDEDGVLACRIPNQIKRDLHVNIQRHDSYVNQTISECRFMTFCDNAPISLTHTITNKPAYAPGETVYITTIVKRVINNSLHSGNQSDSIGITIGNAKDSAAYKVIKPITGDIIIDSFVAPNESTATKFHVSSTYVSPNVVTTTSSTNFLVKETQPSSIALAIDSLPHITKDNSIAIEIRGKHPNGKSLENDSLLLTVFRSTRINHSLNGNRGFYNKGGNTFCRMITHQKCLAFDANNNINHLIKLNPSIENEFIEIEALYIDSMSRRSGTYANTSRYNSPHAFHIQTEFAQNLTNEDVNIFILAKDDQTPLVHKNISVRIENEEGDTITDTTLTTDSMGITLLTQSFTYPNHFYIYVSANNHNGVEVIPIYKSSSYNQYTSLDKKEYSWGDTALVTISHTLGKEFFYAFEGKSLYDFGILKTEKQILPIPIHKKHGLSQHITLRSKSTDDTVGSMITIPIPISSDMHIANVSLEESTEKSKKSIRTIKIQDHRSKPLKATISLSCFNVKNDHIANTDYQPRARSHYARRFPLISSPFRSWQNNTWKSSIDDNFQLCLSQSTLSETYITKGTSRYREKEPSKRKLKRRKKSKRPLKRTAPNWRDYAPSRYSNSFPFHIDDPLVKSPFTYSLTEEENYSYFNPNITTDENGEAEIAIPLPNIEGEWILRAIGSDDAGHLIDFTDTIVTKAE